MQSFYAPSQALQQQLFREQAENSCGVCAEVAEEAEKEKRGGSETRRHSARPQSSLYARNASWNTPKFGSRLGGVGSEYGGGARAVALEAAIRRPNSSEELRELVKMRLSEFDPGHLVGALSRFASLGATELVSSAEVTSLLHAAHQHLDVLTSQDIAGLAWSLAKLVHDDNGSSRQALCQRIASTSDAFTPHHVANVSWALAKLGCCDGTLWAVLAETAEKNLHSATGGELSMTLWAFASSGSTSGVSYANLFSRSSTFVRSKLSELSPTSLANISWAFAKHGVPADNLSIPSEDLFSALCTQASHSVQQFSGWELCTLSWAFVTVQMVDEHVLSQFATRASASSLTLQNASSLAWAFAAAGIADETLFSSISKCIHRQVDELDSGIAARFVWAYGSLEICDCVLFDSIVAFAQTRISEFSIRDLSSLAIGLVRASYKGPTIFAAIAAETLERMQTLGPLELTNIFWAISSQIDALGAIPIVRTFFERTETALLNWTQQRQVEPEALSTAVVALRRIGRLESALELHKMLVIDVQVDEQSDGRSSRRERYRLQFRSQDDGYPKQISYGALLMEAERRGNTQLIVALLESLAEESRSACARTCFLNVAVWTYVRTGQFALAKQLLSRMGRVGLLNIVSERLLRKVGLNGNDLLHDVKTCANELPKWADRRSVAGEMEKTHSKEFSVLQGVLSLKSFEPSKVLAEIEDFGLKRAWIKVAGGEKAAVIETVVAACKPRRVLEYGVYVGYNSMRMALHMQSWGGRVVSMEMDPVHACITRNIALLVGLEEVMTVQLGHSDDAVPLIVEQGTKYDMVFMDQRSTRFHTDLMTLVSLQLLEPGCVVVADNVLKPGAPRWLWHITKGEGYVSDIVSVREFGSAETEDWMTVTFLPKTTFNRCIIPAEPPGMAQITAKADRMRFRTVARNLDDTRRQLEDVNKDFRREFAMWGIIRTKLVKTHYDGTGATSQVVTVQDEDVKDWVGEDPRLSMIGGQWCTDVSKCSEAFPQSRKT